MVSGDYGAFKRKHQGDVQEFTPAAIIEYIKSAGEGFRKMQSERELMKHVQINARATAELVGRMILEKEFIESTQVNMIKRELNKPTHDYGAPQSLWELYQYTTYAMKDVHPTLWMGNHIDAHDFFVTATGELKSKSINIEFETSPIRRQLSIFDQLQEADVVG